MWYLSAQLTARSFSVQCWFGCFPDLIINNLWITLCVRFIFLFQAESSQNQYRNHKFYKYLHLQYFIIDNKNQNTAQNLFNILRHWNTLAFMFSPTVKLWFSFAKELCSFIERAWKKMLLEPGSFGVPESKYIHAFTHIL